MLLSLPDLIDKYNLEIDGVIHVGAHLAEEAELYFNHGIYNVYWFEANPDVMMQVAKEVMKYPGQLFHNALVLDEPGKEVVFHVSNYDGMSSSIYEWGTHTSFSPDTVHVHDITLTSTTLDTIMQHWVPKLYNMLNIDVEGAGLLVLKGADMVMDYIDYVYIEVQTENVYDGAPLLDEYKAFLDDFDLVELGMVEGQGWGDAFFIRR
jgi:FkbM family methyltransferase